MCDKWKTINVNSRSSLSEPYMWKKNYVQNDQSPGVLEVSSVLKSLPQKNYRKIVEPEPKSGTTWKVFLSFSGQKSGIWKLYMRKYLTYIFTTMDKTAKNRLIFEVFSQSKLTTNYRTPTENEHAKNFSHVLTFL